MNIRPIRNEDDYDWALAELAMYFENQPEPGSPDGDRFDVLSDLIEAYENKHWPIEAPDPVEAIKAYMTMNGLKQSNLADVLGSAPRASEVLHRKRRLTVDMIQRICRSWRIPADIMIAPYQLEETVQLNRRGGNA